MSKRTAPPGRKISDRHLGWKTKDGDMFPINTMSDGHLLNAIGLLNSQIMQAKLVSGVTSTSILTLRYMEDEADDRGLQR